MVRPQRMVVSHSQAWGLTFFDTPVRKQVLGMGQDPSRSEHEALHLELELTQGST